MLKKNLVNYLIIMKIKDKISKMYKFLLLEYNIYCKIQKY